MHFSQMEFRQKLLNNKVRRLFEAIEPDLNSFSRLMDLFLTAGGELRESSLSAISRSINEEKMFEIRKLRSFLIEKQAEINDKRAELSDNRILLQTADDKSAPKIQAIITSIKNEIAGLEQEKKSLQVEKDRLQNKLFSQSAQNTLIRAAFSRLDECAEKLGLPTAKNGFAGATFGSINKSPTVASTTPPAPGGQPASPGQQAVPATKKTYKASPPPTGPVAGPTPPATATTKPTPATAPTASPAVPEPQVTPPAQAKAQKGRKTIKMLPSGQAMPTAPGNTAPVPEPAKPVSEPAAKPNAVDPNAKTQMKIEPSPGQSQVRPVPPQNGIGSFGAKLKTQEAKKYFDAFYRWFKTISIPVPDPQEGSVSQNPEEKNVTWLLREYEKIIIAALKDGLLAADTNFSKPEYKSELDPGLFGTNAFPNSIEKSIPPSPEYTKKLVAERKNKFGTFVLNTTATRLRDYFDAKIWPVFSAEMNRLSTESTSFFRTEDVNSVVSTMKELEKSGQDVTSALSGIADSLGVPAETVSALAQLVTNVFDPDMQDKTEPEQENVPAEETPLNQEPIQGSTEKAPPVTPQDYLEVTKKWVQATSGGKTPIGQEKLPEFFAPVIDRHVASLGKDDPKILDKIYYGFESAKKLAATSPELGIKPVDVDNVMKQFGDLITYTRPIAQELVKNSKGVYTPPTTAQEPIQDPTETPVDEPDAPSFNDPMPGTEGSNTELTGGEELKAEDFVQFVRAQGEEFIKSKNLELLRPLIRGFVNSKTEFDAKSPIFTLDAITTSIVSFVGSKDRKLKPITRQIGDVISEKRDELLAMVSDEIKARLSGKQTPINMPEKASTMPQDLSAVVAKARAALSSLETMDPAQLAQMRKKTPDVIIHEIQALRTILQKEGLNAFLNAVSQYLAR